MLLRSKPSTGLPMTASSIGLLPKPPSRIKSAPISLARSRIAREARPCSEPGQRKTELEAGNQTTYEFHKLEDGTTPSREAPAFG